MLSDTIKGIERLHINIPQLLHRDLKTLNLLVTGHSFTVKVADFGLALKNTHSKSDILREMQGTPFYMAPEMTLGTKYTVYSDIYSLGIIIWEMVHRVLNGTYLVPYGDYDEFSGNHGAFTLMMRVSTGLRPTMPKTCPNELKKVIEKTWEAEPEHRMTIQELGQEVTNLQLIYEENKQQWKEIEVLRASVSQNSDSDSANSQNSQNSKDFKDLKLIVEPKNSTDPSYSPSKATKKISDKPESKNTTSEAISPRKSERKDKK